MGISTFSRPEWARGEHGDRELESVAVAVGGTSLAGAGGPLVGDTQLLLTCSSAGRVSLPSVLSVLLVLLLGTYTFVIVIYS